MIAPRTPSRVRCRFLKYFIHRGVAQPGSAPPWGGGGRRFKSSRPDQHPCRGVRIPGQPSSLTTGVRRYRALPSRPDQHCMPSMAKRPQPRTALAHISLHGRSPARTHVKYPRDNSAGSGIGLRSLATLAPSAMIARGESQGWGEQNPGSPSRPDQFNLRHVSSCAFS